MARKHKRIFIAISLSVSLQTKIGRWEKQFAQLPVRWLTGKNLHLTIIPPWYENATGIKTVIANLKKIEKSIGAFSISFNKVSFGPTTSQPRLIWATGAASPKLLFLKKQTEKLLHQKSEKRSFWPHLTLARFRPETFISFPLRKLTATVAWKEKVKFLSLMESRLSRAGADHQTLYRIKL